MIGLTDLPLWAAWIVAILTVAGAAMSLIGVIGMVRLKRFYERVHATTLGATLGTALIVVASILFFSLIEHKLVMRHVLLSVFVMLTTPVTLTILARAAAYRARTEGDPDAPPDV